jgi:hypothetical protein
MQRDTDVLSPEPQPDDGMAYAPQVDHPQVIFASPGVPTSRRIGTGVFLGILAMFTIIVAADQGASVVTSTIIGAFFILGFILYLRIVAPAPYRFVFTAAGLRRDEQGMEHIEIPWPHVVKVKEERFPNGLPISVAVYKRVGAKGLHRSFIVYRDDLPGFEDFLVALKQRVPAEARWNIETVHE